MNFATPPFFFDVLFLRKWRVVSSKVTCCFFKNDVSLFQNDRSFSADVWEWKNNIEERENEYREFYCENSYNHPSSRARVRAHHRSFYLFAVTSVTVFLITRYYSVCYDWFYEYFNNYATQSPKNHRKTTEKYFLKYYFSHLIFTQVWHLWQQKNNIAVGRRARARTLTRMRYVRARLVCFSSVRLRACYLLWHLRCCE